MLVVDHNDSNFLQQRATQLQVLCMPNLTVLFAKLFLFSLSIEYASGGYFPMKSRVVGLSRHPPGGTSCS